MSCNCPLSMIKPENTEGWIDKSNYNYIYYNNSDVETALPEIDLDYLNWYISEPSSEHSTPSSIKCDSIMTFYDINSHKIQMKSVFQQLKYRVSCLVCYEPKDPDKLDEPFCSAICNFIAKNQCLIDKKI